MRKWIGGLVCLLCLTLTGLVLAEEAGTTETQGLSAEMLDNLSSTQATPLMAEEMENWRNGLLIQARQMEILNEPIDTYNPEFGEEYLIEIEDGTIDSLSPTLSGAEQISGAELTGGEILCMRGFSRGSRLESVLAAYPNNNPELVGDEQQAVLYAYGPGEYAGSSQAMYGLLLRQGPQVNALQYVTFAPLQGGQYRQLSVLYIIEGGLVEAMRISGFHTVTSEQAMKEALAAVKANAEASTFAQDSTMLLADVLMLIDLQFEGLFLPEATPEQVTAQYGPAEESDQIEGEQEDGGVYRVLTYPGRTFEFAGQPEALQLTAFTLSDENAVGPRGVTVGMELSDALSLFRLEEQPWQDNRVILYSHGESEDQPPFGMLEYYSDREATLRYAAMGDDGAAWMLHITIADLRVDEVLVYRYVP